MTRVQGTMLITSLIDEDGEREKWDEEGAGQPGIALFANAVQVWAIAQNRIDLTVEEAALAFNTTPDVIRLGVEYHAWMFIGPGDVIEHEAA